MGKGKGKGKGMVMGMGDTSLVELIAQGRHEKALKIIDEKWPRTALSALPSEERLRVLLRWWPDRAAEELSECTALADPSVAEVVAREALALSPEGIEAIVSLDAPFSKELARVCSAASAIGEGRDHEGLDRLRSIGLKSPFRYVRLFLRGLSAFYRNQDDDARRAFSSIPHGHAQWSVAQALLLVIDPEIAGRDAVIEAIPTLRALGLDRAADSLIFRLVQRAVAEGKVNRALSIASKTLPFAGAHLEKALQRELPAALLSGGLDAPSVTRRIERAFAIEGDGPECRHLRSWLLETSNEFEQAVGQWLGVGQDVLKDLTPIPSRDRPIAVAAISQHIGEVVAQCARADDDRRSSSPFVRGRRSSHHSELWEQAFTSFAEAQSLDPKNVEAWQGQIEAAKYLGDKRKSVQVLERFIAQFPEKAEAIIAAARACGERGAYDKGLRFAQRAAVLEPLNRSIRDIEAWLLCGKGRKKFKAGDHGGARGCYEQVRTLASRCTRGQRLKVLAAAAAFDLVTQGRDASSIEQQILVDDPRPWLFQGYLYREGDRLFARRRASRRGGYVQLTSQVPTLPRPESLPSNDQVSALLAIVREEGECKGELAPEYWNLLIAALEAGGSQIEDRDDLDLALAIASTPALKLKLAERGQTLWPEDSQFIVIRYTNALILKLPVTYFEQAEVEIDGAKRAMRDEFEANRVDYTPATARALLLRIASIEHHLDEVVTDVSRYKSKTLRVGTHRHGPVRADRRQLSLFRKD